MKHHVALVPIPPRPSLPYIPGFNLSQMSTITSYSVRLLFCQDGFSEEALALRTAKQEKLKPLDVNGKGETNMGLEL